MRKVYIIRHAQSEGNRFNRADYGKKGGALTEAGIQEAKQLKTQMERLGIRVATEPVAVSELQRTQQTASYAGFEHLVEHAELNEVDPDLSRDELEELIARKQLPLEAIAAAQRLIKNPPQERVWVTHGLVVAALIRELDMPSDRFIPKMASVTEIVLM